MSHHGPASPAPASVLLEAVKRHACLYTRKMNVSDREQEDAWRDVAREVGATVCYCKSEWQRLRRSYVCAINTRRARRHKWLHEDDMSFLRPFVKVRLRFDDSQDGVLPWYNIVICSTPASDTEEASPAPSCPPPQ